MTPTNFALMFLCFWRPLRRIISSLADSPNRETPMHRFSLLFFVIVLSTSSLAQSIFDRKQTIDLITVTKYCANVDEYSDSQVPRIFARVSSASGQSTDWTEFNTRAAWSRAGRPRPVALVWYRDAKLVRVAISENDDESPRVYADYCYRSDGTLARLRSVPSKRQKCEPSRYQCTLVLREVRFYPSEGPVLKTYGGIDGLLDWVNGNPEIFGEEALPAERMVETVLPMKWPEYLHVTDLPFNDLLFASLR